VQPVTLLFAGSPRLVQDADRIFVCVEGAFDNLVAITMRDVNSPSRAQTGIRPSHKLPCDHSTDTRTTYHALPASRQSSIVPVHKGVTPLPRARGPGHKPGTSWLRTRCFTH
jgi:hypothetical protein